MYYTCASILMSNFYIKRQLIPWRTIIICSVAGFPLLASLAAKSNIEIKKALIVLWRLNENNILKWMDTYIGCTLTLETLSLDKHCYFDSWKLWLRLWYVKLWGRSSRKIKSHTCIAIWTEFDAVWIYRLLYQHYWVSWVWWLFSWQWHVINE